SDNSGGSSAPSSPTDPQASIPHHSSRFKQHRQLMERIRNGGTRVTVSPSAPDAASLSLRSSSRCQRSRLDSQHRPESPAPDHGPSVPYQPPSLERQSLRPSTHLPVLPAPLASAPHRRTRRRLQVRQEHRGCSPPPLQLPSRRPCSHPRAPSAAALGPGTSNRD